MPYIAGADGCKGGWIVVYKRVDEGSIHSSVVTGMEELFDSVDDLAVLAIDIPIRLTDSLRRRSAATRGERGSSLIDRIKAE